MAQRTYLICAGATKSREIFEAKNMIPFFWLTLIQDQDLQAKVPEMNKAYLLWNNAEANEQDQDEAASNANIKIPKAKALTNARSVIPFMENHFPQFAALFDDFINYLDLQLNQSDFIEIDLLSLAAFPDITSLTETISQQLYAIKENNAEAVSGYFNHDDKYSLVGYDGAPGDEFKNHSPAYANTVPAAKLQADAEHARKNIPLSAQQQKSRRSKAIFLLMIGALFFFFTIVGFKKDGLSFATASCFIISIAAAWLAISKLTNRNV